MSKHLPSADSIDTGASSNSNSQLFFPDSSIKSQKSNLTDIRDEEQDDDYEFSKIPEINEENLKSAKPSAERNSNSRIDVTSSYYYLSKPEAERIKEFQRLKEEQERLVKRQIELAELRKRQLDELKRREERERTFNAQTGERELESSRQSDPGGLKSNNEQAVAVIVDKHGGNRVPQVKGVVSGVRGVEDLQTAYNSSYFVDKKGDVHRKGDNKLSVIRDEEVDGEDNEDYYFQNRDEAIVNEKGEIVYPPPRVGVHQNGSTLENNSKHLNGHGQHNTQQYPMGSIFPVNLDQVGPTHHNKSNSDGSTHTYGANPAGGEAHSLTHNPSEPNISGQINHLIGPYQIPGSNVPYNNLPVSNVPYNNLPVSNAPSNQMTGLNQTGGFHFPLNHMANPGFNAMAQSVGGLNQIGHPGHTGHNSIRSNLAIPESHLLSQNFGGISPSDLHGVHVSSDGSVYHGNPTVYSILTAGSNLNEPNTTRSNLLVPGSNVMQRGKLNGLGVDEIGSGSSVQIGVTAAGVDSSRSTKQNPGGGDFSGREPPPVAKRSVAKNTKNATNKKTDQVTSEKDVQTIKDMKNDLKQAKDNRLELEKSRDDLLKSLKNIHHRMMLRKKEAKDIWKKRYYGEKKKTPELEERAAEKAKEVEQLQGLVLTEIEDELRAVKREPGTDENELKLNWLTALKYKEEIYLYKQQLDQAKLKLITELKLRSQADLEAKQLRAELIHTKISLNEMKNTT